jgi:hypothetical protein
MSSARNLPTFRRNVVHSHSGTWSLKIDAIICSETYVTIYQTVRCNMSQDLNIQQHRCENLISRNGYLQCGPWNQTYFEAELVRILLISFKGFYLQKSQAVRFSYREKEIKIKLKYVLNCRRYGGAEYRLKSDLEFMISWRYFISTKQDIMTQFVGHKTTEINTKAGHQSFCLSGSSHFACLQHTLLKFRLDIWPPCNLHIRSTEIIKCFDPDLIFIDFSHKIV